MPSCQVCDAYLSPLQYANADCPTCREKSEELEAHAQDQWRSAAKVTNLAEAGYLASCLEAKDIDAQLIESDSFNAIGGEWTRSYTLQVPAGCLSDAKSILREESELILGEQREYGRFGEPIDDEPVHLVFWRPVALMAVAGLATLWLSQRAPDPRPRVAPNRNAAALGAAIDALGEPLVIETDRGQVRHRLRFDRAHQAIQLDSDTDGDGRLDRRQRFVLDQAGQ
ncbi:hypothetical protein [Aeoliella sp.]|uniref:hypothetical protein n=1 Tax=Aeoliella sp. TaxID=2795800 RepID=UPI003CCC12AD